MVVDIPNHSFSFSLSPFFLSLFSLFSLFSRVQLSGRAPPAGTPLNPGIPRIHMTDGEYWKEKKKG